jgi:hypothetical protein
MGANRSGCARSLQRAHFVGGSSATGDPASLEIHRFLGLEAVPRISPSGQFTSDERDAFDEEARSDVDAGLPADLGRLSDRGVLTLAAASESATPAAHRIHRSWQLRLT